MEPIVIDRKESKLRVAPEWADVCFTCGTCASGCPVTGVDNMDPRKAVRMAALGLDQELIDYADLVTEMREIKHPYKLQGVRAQKGIEF